MMDDDEPQLGRLTVTVGKTRAEQTTYTLAVDRLAVAKDGMIYLLSAAGAQGEVKGLRAAMGGGVAATLQIEGARFSRDGKEVPHKAGGPVRADDTFKYACHAHPLGFGVTHALFLSKAPGFLRTVDLETVWRELKRPEFTTPLLRGWAGPVAAELERLELLKPLYCFGCSCAVISAQTVDLDKIVEAGVRRGSLPFRDSAA